MMVDNQKPRICIEPEYRDTDGEGARLLMERYSKPLDKWQRNIMNCWLSKDDKGEYIVTSGGLSVPRQNGKNFIIEAIEFYRLVVNGEKILHTAHLVSTYKKAFRRLERLFTDKRYPEITALVDHIRYANGEEEIVLKNGGSIEYLSRSGRNARGYDALSLIVFDEAQELTDDQIEALMATLSASDSGNRQLLYAGTPPYPTCTGTIFRRFRESIIQEAGEGKNSHNSWHEWSVSGNLDEIDVNDRKLWRQCNPAMSIRLTEEFTAEELKTLPKDGFCRERLGWWSPILSQQVVYAIDHKKWAECGSDLPAGEDKKVAYGVKFSADGSNVCLCGASLQEDKTVRIEVIERKQTGCGISWLVSWLNERKGKACCVVVDGKNGADLLIDRLSETWKFKDSVIHPSASDVIASVSFLINEVNEHTITWYKPQEMLNNSAVTATKRVIGKGFGFGGEDATPIECCALALWAVRTSKRNPMKKMKLG